MKKRILLLLGYLFSLLLATTPALAQADGSDSYDPPILPNQVMATVQQTSQSELEVVFLADADEAEVEVATNNGEKVYQANGSASTNSKVRINARSWGKGCYTVKVRMEGKLVTLTAITVE